MVFAFDTLSYARYLRDHGVAQEHAEAHAEATRQFVMVELVTKADLNTAVAALGQRLDAKVEVLSERIEAVALRLTIRLGLMLAGGLTLLGAVQKML